ncbi:Protein BOI2 [Pleurostoma richardsiae]|uniref:Protein BOI2 n=1 Tax=Pleurostoma richardsiae TaxID=41990 RepID=A0AA38RVM6_9PEZI|nr:Protein BOI2 [Pleurostoma richardsiae]
MASQSQPKPEVGDILLVIHDFQARSSDELSLAKGDRVELIERDDEFGDGWFLGKHLVNGNSGLFPEVYTRPAPKGVPNPPATPIANQFSQRPQPLATLPETPPQAQASLPIAAPVEDVRAVSTPLPTIQKTEPTPVTLPLSSFKSNSLSGTPVSSYSAKSVSTTGSVGSIGRLNNGSDSQVLHETLNVIDEHITDLRSPLSNGGLRNANDSGSEYSSHLDHRLSYIQGEETDEEEEGAHSRMEVEAWSSDEVAEYLFTTGVEKHHCEVFRDQEITGEVLLGMDQTSLFIKAFDLGSVGRRLKTWQKIKALQDEVNGLGIATRRTTQTYGSDVGSDDRVRSRTNTLTSSVTKLPPIEDRPSTSHNKRRSITSTPKINATQALGSPVSPRPLDSPTRALHEKRPSAASVRELHHSRRHSSTDFRLTGTTLNPTTTTPKLIQGNTFPQQEPTAHKKQPSFDRNWTLGSATALAQRPLSSAGFQELVMSTSDPAIQDSAVDLDRGYFSGTEVDGRKRNVLKKRDSSQAHSRNTSYTEEQRVRSATALSRHSRFGSVDSVRQDGVSPAVQKYYGLSSVSSSGPHRRTASTTTSESIRPVPPAKDTPSPTVTKLDNSMLDNTRSSPRSPISPANRHGIHADWFSKQSLKNAGLGLRAISDAVTGHERSKLSGSPMDSPLKESPMQSPSRTGSSTPSGGPSFDLESPDPKSPNTLATATSRGSRKKGKKETSAYLRGLQRVPPREAIADADYSGWMKKKSSNLMTTWKPRLFVLKGRRLAYYYSEDDEQEKGLIDISFHRVLPADNEKLTGLHATITGASNTPTMPAGSNMPTLAATQADLDTTLASDNIFIFKLVPPRAGLSRAVNFTKPTVHYFAVPNVKQGRLWMAALMKATIDRDDAQPITTTYQQKTISLAKARAMRHRPPALMNLDEKLEDAAAAAEDEEKKAAAPPAAGGGGKKDAVNVLGIVFNEEDSGVSGFEKLGLQKVESARTRFPFEGDNDGSLPQSA